jgi:hypothetical protein
MVKAGKLRSEASFALQDRNGKACLDKLDEADRLDPDPARVSTNPRSMLMMRALCTMLAGRCDEGVVLLDQAYATMMKDLGPTHREEAIEGQVGTYCGDGATVPRHKLRVATSDLQRAHLREAPDDCAKTFDRVMKAIATFTPVDAKDTRALESARSSRMLGAMCVGAAGRCAQGFSLYEATSRADQSASSRMVFDAMVPGCKGR